MESSVPIGVERSPLFGVRRNWKLINRYEIIFLILGVVAAVTTIILTALRLDSINNGSNPDVAYGILIIVHTVFLLLFLFTGIFQQRITDVVAFFISAVLLTIYVVVHFIIRESENDSEKSTDRTIRLIRLIITVIFNIIFLPLAIYVVRDYRRDEFSIRLLGSIPEARVPLRIYYAFECVVRINGMLSISTLLLNLYNFNEYEPVDKSFLGVGLPVVFLWLGTGVGMARLESKLLLAIFLFVSLFQPGFLGYCLYSAIHDPSTTTTVAYTMMTAAIDSNSTSTLPTSIMTSTKENSTIPVIVVLYVCIGANLLTHIASVIIGVIFSRTFGRQLREKVFNNLFDRFFQRLFSKKQAS